MRINCFLCDCNYQAENAVEAGLLRQDSHSVAVVILWQFPEAQPACSAHIQLLDSHLLAISTPTRTSQSSNLLFT